MRWLRLTAVVATLTSSCAYPPRPGRTDAVRESLPMLVCFTNAASWPREGSNQEGTLVLRSPAVAASAAWDELVVSWNVAPATGAGLEIQAEALWENAAAPFYHLGRWSLDGTLPRASVRGQRDEFGEVLTDTLKLTSRPADGTQLRLVLHGTLAREPERIRLLAVSLANRAAPPAPRPDFRDAWGCVLDVPERAQTAYPGGRGWCSPTALSMVLGWWSKQLGRPELDVDVPEIARAVHDPQWPGTGNWTFNVAFAGQFPHMRACVARLRDLRAVEQLVAAGIPPVMSVDYKRLKDQPPEPDAGHLVVCVGFTAKGEPVLNDPWARLEEGQRVRRVYSRSNLVAAWEHSNRTAYLIAPDGQSSAFPALWR